MQTETGTLVPPRRLGTLLRQARVAAGLDLEELAARQRELTVVDLDDLEHGRRIVDDSLLNRLVALYGVEDAGLLPSRSQLVIDLDEGRIAVDQSDVSTDGLSGPDAVLARYLALVYHLRELPLGTAIGLRDVDLEVLSTALEIETIDIEQRLKRLMSDEDAIAADQRRIRRRMLMPLVGVVIAACSAGVLILVADSDDAPDPTATSTQTDADVSMPATSTADVETDIGNGGAVAEAATVETRLGGAAVETNPEG